MSQRFSITAELQLREPRNLRAVANKIHKTINGSGGGSSLASPQANRNLAVMKAQLADVAAQSTKTAKAVSTAGDSMSDFAKKTGLATKRFAAFVVGAGAIVSLFAAMKGGIAEGIRFQSEMVKIAQITGKSTSQLRDLSDEIHSLGSGLGSSSRGLQQATNTLTQAGLSATDTKIALQALAKTDLAPTFDNIKNTTEGAIAIFGQFNTSAKDLEGQLGSINSVSARYAVESSDLVTAIRKSGGAFKAAGGQLNELLGLFTSVRSTTRESADSIANAFRTIFARLQRPKTQQSLKELLGVDLAEGGQFVGPIKAIERLHHALADLPSGSLVFAKAAEEIGGIRQISKVVPLIQQYGKAIEAVKVAEEGTLSLNRDVITAQESLGVQISRTRESWQKFFDLLVDDSGFKSTVGSLLSLSRGLASIADSLRPLIPALTLLGGIKLAGFALPAVGRKVLGHASGGYISSGRGSMIDDQPAMLARGEYVLNASATSKIGKGNLDAVNFGNARHFRSGGSPDDSPSEIRIRDHAGRNARRKAYRQQQRQEGATAQKIDIALSIDLAQPSKQALERTAQQLGGGYSMAPAGTLAPEPGRPARNLPSVGPGTYGLAPVGTSNTVTAVRRSRGQGYAVHPVGYRPNSFESTVLAGLPSARLGSIPLDEEFFLRGEPQPRSRNFRGLSRAEREARINEYGRGGLLSSVRRSSLAAMSEQALAARGYTFSDNSPGFAHRGLSAAGNGLSKLGSFAAQNSRGVALGIGAVALTGQAETLAGKLGGDKAKTATSSAITYGTSGAVLGAGFGPVGAALGGIAGAAVGVVAGLNEFEKELHSKKIEAGFKSISDASTSLAAALTANSGNLNADVRKKASALFGAETANRSRIEASQIDKNVAGRAGLAGGLSDISAGYGEIFRPLGGLSIFGGKGYSATRKDLVASAEQAKQKAANELVLQNYSGNIESREAFKSALIKQSRNAGDFGRTNEGQDYIFSEASRRAAVEKQRLLQDRPLQTGESAQILSKYTREVEAETAALEKSTVARKANISVIDAFDRQVASQVENVKQLTGRLADLGNASQSFENRTALLSSITGNSPATLGGMQLSARLGRFGSAGFEGAATTLGGIAPGLAGNSALLAHANRAHLALNQALPTSLDGSLDIGTDQGFDNLRTGIGRAFARNGVGGNVQQQIFRQLDELRNEPTFKDFGTGKKNNELRDKLLAFAKDVQSAEVEAAKGIEEHGHKLSENLGRLASLGNDIIATHHATDQAHLQGMEFADQRRQARGLPSTLSVAARQQPFLLNQQRLTGLQGEAALNPHAILSSIQSNRQQLLAAQSRAEANPADANAIGAVRGFEVQLQRSVQALKNLTDASNLNAAAQERLTKLDSERNARQNLGEHFFGLSATDRQRFGADAGIAQQAVKHGTLDRLSVEQQQRAVGFLQQSRDIKLFGGEETGGQHLERLINNSARVPVRPLTKREQFLQARQNKLQNSPAFQRLSPEEQQKRLDRIGFSGPSTVPLFGQRPNDQAESQALEKQIGGNFGRAVRANAAVGSVQQANQNDLAEGIRQSVAGFDQSIGRFSQSQAMFNESVSRFDQAAAKIPHSIDLKGSHELQVNINGADMLARLQPQILESISKAAQTAVNDMLRKKLPELGVT